MPKRACVVVLQLFFLKNDYKTEKQDITKMNMLFVIFYCLDIANFLMLRHFCIDFSTCKKGSVKKCAEEIELMAPTPKYGIQTMAKYL